MHVVEQSHTHKNKCVCVCAEKQTRFSSPCFHNRLLPNPFKQANCSTADASRTSNSIRIPATRDASDCPPNPTSSANSDLRFFYRYFWLTPMAVSTTPLCLINFLKQYTLLTEAVQRAVYYKGCFKGPQ